jgi:hypothetical protein
VYREALAAQWDVNTPNPEDGQNALTCAVVSGRVDAARVLLDAGAWVSPRAFVMSLGVSGADGTMLALLDHAAPLDVHSALARRLLTSASHNNPEAWRYLVARGVDSGSGGP